MADYLSVRQLAARLGYHEESVRRRIRQLRNVGKVRDKGAIPAIYPTAGEAENGGEEFNGLTLVWLHPQFFIIDPQFSEDLFPGRNEKEQTNAE